MQKVTADWIKQHLGPERGAQAKLAEAIGMHPNHMAKVMAGRRKLSGDEVLGILDYFRIRIVSDPTLVPLVDRVMQLPPEDREDLLRFADYLRVRQGRPPDEPEKQD